MDTYWHNSFTKCVACCRCVTACKKDGEGFLGGVRDKGPYTKSDYVPCHHCGEGDFKHKPCQLVCHYNAITIERW